LSTALAPNAPWPTRVQLDLLANAWLAAAPLPTRHRRLPAREPAPERSCPCLLVVSLPTPWFARFLPGGSTWFGDLQPGSGIWGRDLDWICRKVPARRINLVRGSGICNLVRGSELPGGSTWFGDLGDLGSCPEDQPGSGICELGSCPEDQPGSGICGSGICRHLVKLGCGYRHTAGPRIINGESALPVRRANAFSRFRLVAGSGCSSNGTPSASRRSRNRESTRRR